MRRARRVKVYSQETYIAQADVADTFFTRFRGLMGQSPIERPLWIAPCADIHTFCMKEPIDVVFLSREGKVLRIIEAMPKNKMSGAVKGAYSVLELPAYALRKLDCMEMSTISFVEEG